MAPSGSTRRSVWTFFALTYGLSWLCWVPAAAFGHDYTGSLWLVPYMLGGFGPSLAGIIMASRSRGREGRRDLWKRLVDVRRISAGWHLFIVLVFPTSFAVTFLIERLSGRPLPELAMLGEVAANPLLLIGMALGGIITGPLSEELGWRGFALERLQSRRSPLVASLILALLWWAWHLPLFFMEGTTHHAWGIGTPAFWLFLLGTVPLSVLLTWVYNQNRRSVLAAVLLHFTYNLTLSLVHPMSLSVHVIHVITLWVVAALLVLLAGREDGLESERRADGGPHLGRKEDES